MIARCCKAILATPSILGMTVAVSLVANLAEASTATEPPVQPTSGAAALLDTQPVDSSVVDSVGVIESGEPASHAKATVPIFRLPVASPDGMAAVSSSTPGTIPQLGTVEVEPSLEASFATVRTNKTWPTPTLDVAQAPASSPGELAPPPPSEAGDAAPSTASPTESASPAPESPTPTESPANQEPAANASQSNRWHFLLQPYMYLPLSIYGNANIRGFDVNVNVGPDQVFSAVRNDLEFAFFGRLETWSPNYRWGILLNGDYLAGGKNGARTLPSFDRLDELILLGTAKLIRRELDGSIRTQLSDQIQQAVNQRINERLDGPIRERLAELLRQRLDGRLRDRLAEVIRDRIEEVIRDRLDGSIRDQIKDLIQERLDQIIPSDLKSDVKIQTWSADLAFAYRFFNESQAKPNAATEFELGPFLFDLIAGVRFTGSNGELDTETNLGVQRSASRSVTRVLPLAGARIRYNAAHNLALVVAGTVAGFDISSLGLQWEALAGVDWMFSGNTSVGLGYRFAGNQYKIGSGRDAFSFNLNNNGPYLSLTFRF